MVNCNRLLMHSSLVLFIAPNLKLINSTNSFVLTQILSTTPPPRFLVSLFTEWDLGRTYC